MQLLACRSSQSVVPIACCLLAILCCVFPSSSNNDCLPDQQQSVCWFSRQEFTTRCNCEHQVFCTFSAPVCGKLCPMILFDRFHRQGFEIIPVYLSISGNFRKWQVKNIDACRRRQARKTSIIHNLSIWIIFPSIFHQHACSLVQFIGVLAWDSHGICGSYQTLLNKNEMMQSL